MKNAIKIPLIIVSIFVVIIAAISSMFIFQLCPPDGPWPMPPWCSYKSAIYLEDYEYHKLDYITETYEPTSKKLEFGVSPFDIWGNPHLWIDLGEVTTKNYPKTLERIGQINSQTVMITDFAIFGQNGSVIIADETQAPATYNIKQSELNDFVSTARANRQNKIILILNLVETASALEEFNKKAKEEGILKEQVAGKLYEKYINEQTGLATGKEYLTFNESQRQATLDQWKDFVIFEAEKAEKAGITHLLINSRHVQFDFMEVPSVLNQYYQNLASEVRQHFSGKIGLQMPLYLFKEINSDNVDFVLVEFDPNSDWQLKNILENTGQSIPKLENALAEYFNLKAWDSIAADEIYLNLQLLSYDGAIQNGWIEIGGIYPGYTSDQKEQALIYEALFRTLYNKDTKIDGVISYGYWWTNAIYPDVKVIRNDLGASIRNKDAEHVFYKWSKIFG